MGCVACERSPAAKSEGETDAFAGYGLRDAVRLSSVPHAANEKVKLGKLMINRRRDWRRERGLGLSPLFLMALSNYPGKFFWILPLKSPLAWVSESFREDIYWLQTIYQISFWIVSYLIIKNTCGNGCGSAFASYSLAPRHKWRACSQAYSARLLKPTCCHNCLQPQY